MAYKRRRSLLRRPAVLLVAFVSIVALTGVVYAHWYTDATVNGFVNTGNLGVQFWDGGTDDDGNPTNDWSTNDKDDAFGGPPEAWDGHLPDMDNPRENPGSSADPREPYPYTDGVAQRYDKDVAICHAYANQDGSLQVDVQNAYPSYYCTGYGLMYGDGNVPVKAAGAYVNGWEFFEAGFFGWFTEPDGGGDEWFGDVADWPPDGYCADGVQDNPDTPEDEYEPGDGVCEGEDRVFPHGFETQLEVRERAPGVYTAWEGRRHVMTVYVRNACGIQVDPWFFDWGEPSADDLATWGAVSVHLDQGAESGNSYGFTVHPKFVNWNEFSRDLCTFELIEPEPEPDPE